jgi:hypothetical protein
MKYLIKYKIFENSLNFLSDISDILLELKDINFNVEIDTKPDIIEITISKNKHYMRYGGIKSEFKYSEIEDTVDRLLYYTHQSNMITTVNFGRNMKGGYRMIDLKKYKPKASIIFCKLSIKKVSL